MINGAATTNGKAHPAAARIGYGCTFGPFIVRLYCGAKLDVQYELRSVAA